MTAIPLEATAPFPKTWLTVTSFVTALLGMAVLAIVFGHLGVNAANRGQADFKGLGVAGLVIGYAEIAVAVAAIGVTLAGGLWCADSPGTGLCPA